MTPDLPPTRPPWRARLAATPSSARTWLTARDRGLSRGAIIIGALGATLALWPLATTAWSALGLNTAQSWRMVGAGVSALILAAGVRRAARRRSSPIRLAWLILIAWLVAAGLVAALTAIAWFLLGTPTWSPPGSLSARSLDAIATRAFAIVAGLGGVALLVIHYRRQRTTEEDAKRADAAATREVSRIFHERYASAYADLGSEHAAVRLGAVNALAHLVDDAPSEQEAQTVIDVLCAYLRMPYVPRPAPLTELPVPSGLQSVSPTSAVELGRPHAIGHDHAQFEKQKADQEEYQRRVLEFESFQQVRHTIIRIIGNRLRENTRWRGKNFDFTGVVFDGGDFSGAHFTGGVVSFTRARFVGGDVSFIWAQFNDAMVSFDWARFEGGEVSFNWAWFEGGWVSFSRACFVGSEVSFNEAWFEGGEVPFSSARFEGGEVSFDWVRFECDEVSFEHAQFLGGLVSFTQARFVGGEVSFEHAQFLGGLVSFTWAQFMGGEVSFEETQLMRGWMVFTWGGLTADLAGYRDAYGQCPKGLMEAQEKAPTRVLLAPAAWGQR
ncbi:pentapeptide repeat-containing protein [Nocardiopsis sp. CA-288880]|uniref:pentapeptide repeat-containing protein n=1 Tax=Nocardiopsis sp. CA-288880 TaxID=3239995 RepID=UPI003D99BCAE